MSPIAVGTWVQTPEGLGKVLRIETSTSWIFRRAERRVWVHVELMDGTRKAVPAAAVQR